MASGIAALILSANPNLNWLEVRQIMRDTAVKIQLDNIVSNEKWFDKQGNAIIDGNKSLLSISSSNQLNQAANIGHVEILVLSTANVNIGQVLKFRVADGDIRIVKAINANVITIDQPLTQYYSQFTTIDFGLYPYKSKAFGYGRLDAAAAVQSAIDSLTGARYDLWMQNTPNDNGEDDTIDICSINSPDIFYNKSQDKINVRVRNRGAATSIKGAEVRCMVAIVDDVTSIKFPNTFIPNNVDVFFYGNGEIEEIEPNGSSDIAITKDSDFDFDKVSKHKMEKITVFLAHITPFDKESIATEITHNNNITFNQTILTSNQVVSAKSYTIINDKQLLS